MGGERHHRDFHRALGALFCTLYGYTVPFTTAELKSLYKNHGDYVSGVVHETNDLLMKRFLQSWNADTIKESAGESSILERQYLIRRRRRRRRRRRPGRRR